MKRDDFAQFKSNYYLNIILIIDLYLLSYLDIDLLTMPISCPIPRAKVLIGLAMACNGVESRSKGR